MAFGPTGVIGDLACPPASHRFGPRISWLQRQNPWIVRWSWIWLQLCCDLGAIPVECTVTMRAINEMNTDQDNHHDYERLIAMTSCTAQSPQKMALGPLGPFRDRLEVAINGFDPGATYQFILHARPHLPVLGRSSRSSTAETLLKMEFQEVARSEVFQWPSQLSEEWSCMVNWSLPVPRSVVSG